MLNHTIHEFHCIFLELIQYLVSSVVITHIVFTVYSTVYIVLICS